MSRRNSNLVKQKGRKSSVKRGRDSSSEHSEDSLYDESSDLDNELRKALGLELPVNSSSNDGESQGKTKSSKRRIQR